MTTPNKPPVAAHLSRAVLAASLALLGSTAMGQATSIPPGSPGYVTNQSGGTPVTNAYGQCWKTGAWNPAVAKEPCDVVPRAAAAVVPPVAAAPTPAPQPAYVAPAPNPAPPLTVVETPRPVIEKVTLSTDVLFEFGKADLRDSGKGKIDELAQRIKGQGANVEEVLAIGHADRIATDDFNQKLSEARAEAVKTYLVDKGLQSSTVKTEGRGESQPVTGDDCRKMGPERGNNRKLVQCLAPDRRVEIEVLGSRSTAQSQPGTAGAGPSGSAVSGPSR